MQAITVQTMLNLKYNKPNGGANIIPFHIISILQFFLPQRNKNINFGISTKTKKYLVYVVYFNQLSSV